MGYLMGKGYWWKMKTNLKDSLKWGKKSMGL